MKALSVVVLLYLFGVIHINGILNGNEATENTFGYQVAVHQLNRREIVCNGAILTSRLILTGATRLHVMNLSPKDIFVTVGTIYLYNKSSPGIRHDIAEIILHRSYDIRTCENDIALLRTVEDIKFTSLIQPILLPSIDHIENVNTNASGWGRIDVSKQHF